MTAEGIAESENELLIERFYAAFGQGDADTMASCYDPEVRFSDPVFTDLQGPDVMKMWRMLLSRSDDINITLGEHSAGDGRGKAHWTAKYNFSRTGRDVVNEIDANFLFRDGLIVEHSDSFDFWKWSRMALGTSGLLLGWSPVVKRKVRAESAAMLESAG